MKSGLFVLASLGSLLLGGCTVLNRVEVCDTAPREARINQRGDEDELINHPQSAALLASGKILVAYNAESDATSAVRYAMVDPSTGRRSTIGSGVDLEGTLTGESSFSATVARADLDLPGGAAAAAAIGWTQVVQGVSSVRMRFLDSAGSVLQSEFTPGAPGALTSAAGLALAWLPERRAVLAAYRDETRVYENLVEAASPSAPIEIASEGFMMSDVASAVGDTSALLAWTAAENVADFAARKFRVRAALLDLQGNLRAAAATNGARRAFTIPFPVGFVPKGSDITVAAAAGRGRFVVAVSGAEQADGTSRVYYRELDAADGEIVGAPLPADEADPGNQNLPSVAYLPEDTLLVDWSSTSRSGTTARLFASGGDALFTSVACDEGAFAVGPATAKLVGVPAPLYAKDNVWVFHTGTPGDDLRGTGVLGWWMAFTNLWPKR